MLELLDVAHKGSCPLLRAEEGEQGKNNERYPDQHHHEQEQSADYVVQKIHTAVLQSFCSDTDWNHTIFFRDFKKKSPRSACALEYYNDTLCSLSHDAIDPLIGIKISEAALYSRLRTVFFIMNLCSPCFSAIPGIVPADQ